MTENVETFKMELDLSDKKYSFKTFNQATKEFLIHQTDDNATSLLEIFRELLSSNQNWQALDPTGRDILDFFVNLQELLKNRNERNEMTEAVLEVLDTVCKHQHLKDCLVRVFKFVPELTKLLQENPIKEKKLKILLLIQELTYGIKISWQEAYLQVLISTLTNWIMGNEPTFLLLSLGILVNLCYKNTPAVYLLMKCVDIKYFLRVLFKIHKNSAEAKVQVCKLLIILEDVSGVLPKAELENFIQSICPRLEEAISGSDYSVMKQIINFFKDIINSDKTKKVVGAYSNYPADIETILNIVSGKDDLNLECLAPLFDYLCCIIDLEIPGLDACFLQMLKLTFRFIGMNSVSPEALDLIRKVMANVFSNSGDISSQQQSVIEYIQRKLPEIIYLLDVGVDIQGFDEYSLLHKLSSLIRLLYEIVLAEPFSSLDTKLFDKSVVVFTKLFNPLLQPNCKESYIFQKAVHSFYVEVLSFISALSKRETTWLLLYNDLLQEKQVQMVLAIALYTGNECVKKKVLTLTGTTGFSSDCLALLANQMNTLNRLVSVSPLTTPSQDFHNITSSSSYTSLDFMPILNLTQHGYLNSVLEKCELAARKNENSLTSSIMELYHYRIAVLEQSLRQAQVNQEAADRRAAEVQMQLALTSAEISRLHSHLHSTQLSFEEVTKESKTLSNNLNNLKMEAEEIKNNYLQSQQNLSSKTVIISQLNQDLDHLKTSLSSLEKESKQLSKELHQKKTECSDLTQEINALRKNISGLESSLASIKKESDAKSQKIDSLNKEIVELSSAKKKLMASSLEKDNHISELTKELNDLKRMQELISELAMGKRKAL